MPINKPEEAKWSWAASRGVNDEDYPRIVPPKGMGRSIALPRLILGSRADEAVAALVAVLNDVHTDGELWPCCLNEASRIDAMSPMTCSGCGATLSVRNRTWIREWRP